MDPLFLVRARVNGIENSKLNIILNHTVFLSATTARWDQSQKNIATNDRHSSPFHFYDLLNRQYYISFSCYIVAIITFNPGTS